MNHKNKEEDLWGCREVTLNYVLNSVGLRRSYAFSSLEKQCETMGSVKRGSKLNSKAVHEQAATTLPDVSPPEFRVF